MSEQIQESNQKQWNDLADKYKQKKTSTMTNILICGKILHEAKESMGHGLFGEFLADSRVSESIRTAQRLMVIFKNFQHLLQPEKIDALKHLGVSHMLELKNLPDRFKKEIEVIKVKDEEETREMVKVIDEEKLGDFLETQVDFDGESMHIRDLPVTEMRRHIREVQGIYDPNEDGQESDESDSQEENARKKQIESDGKKESDKFGKILGDLTILSDSMFNMTKQLEEIDTQTIQGISEKEKQKLKTCVARSRSFASAFMVRVEDLTEKIV